MDPLSVVVVSLHSPKERIWGELSEITVAGVTLRGIDLNSFDDFIRQVMHPEGERIGLPTLFFPMQRIERIALDEARGSIPSLGKVCAQGWPDSWRLPCAIRLTHPPERIHGQAHFHGTQPAHLPAAGLSPILYNRHPLQPVRLGAGVAGCRGTERRSRWTAGPQAEPENATWIVSGSHCR